MIRFKNTLPTIRELIFSYLTNNMPTRINLPLFGEKRNRNPGAHIILLNCIGIKKSVSKYTNGLLVWVINNQQSNKCPATCLNSWLNVFVLGIPRLYERL